MTNEAKIKDAIGCIKQHRRGLCDYNGDWSFFDTAIKALEKQIPKKPPNHDRMVCPSCNSKARYGHPYEYYCPHCGQAILWEVSE